MDEGLLVRLAATEDAFEETLTQLADQEILSDQNRYREVTTRHAELKPVVEAYRQYLTATEELEEATELRSG